MEVKTINGYDIKDETARNNINVINDSYYNEITYKKGRVHHTDYYITYIPKYDNQNNIIMPYVAYNNGKSPSEYARENYTTFSSNCTLGIGNPGGGSYGIPSVISNGEIIRNNDLNSGQNVADSYVYLGIKENRDLVEYKVNSTTAQQMLNDGCIQVFNPYYRLLENGEASDLTNVVTNEPNVVTDEHPRQALGVKSDGTIVILTCDGRTYESNGLTSAELQEILLEENCVNAWNLDGGGSSSTTIKGSKLNRNIDDNGTSDRGNSYSLNIKKINVNKGIGEAFSKIGEEKQNIIQQLIPLFQSESLSVNTTNINGHDLNNEIGKIIFAYGTNLINYPNINSGYLINIPHAAEEFKELYNTQLFVTRSRTEMFIRNQINGVWDTWEKLNGPTMVDMIPQAITHNEIIETNTYQSLKFINSYGSNLSKSIIHFDETTKDENDCYSAFKVDKTGYFKLSINLQYTSVSSGIKYVKLTKNGNDIPNTLKRNTINEGVGLLHLERIVNNDLNDVYEVKIYGTENDSIQYGSVMVELI